MRKIEYWNRFKAKCPVCGKIIMNEYPYKGEVNDVHPCKHLLFAQDSNDAGDILFYVRNKFKKLFTKQLDHITTKELKIFEKINPNIRIYRYKSFGAKTYFVYDISGR